MRLFPIFVSISFCFISCLVSASDFLVISDVDDTLKVSHVKSAFEKVGNALRTDLVFPAMPELFQDLSEVGAKIIYVSAAPEAIAGDLHPEFLERHEFPQGDLHLSPGLFPTDKLPVLRQLIKSEKPKFVIFFGDNGEKDPYNSMLLEKEFPKVKFLTFIRWAYPNGLHSEFYQGQIPFLTTGEVALKLYSENILSAEQARSLVGASMPATPELLGLPEWIECEGYSAQTPFFPPAQRLVDDLFESISVRCPRDSQWSMAVSI